MIETRRIVTKERKAPVKARLNKDDVLFVKLFLYDLVFYDALFTTDWKINAVEIYL